MCANQVKTQFHGNLTAVSLKIGRTRAQLQFCRRLIANSWHHFISTYRISRMQCIELSGHISWVNRFNLSHNVLHINYLNLFDSCAFSALLHHMDMWKWIWMCTNINKRADENYYYYFIGTYIKYSRHL